MKNNFYKKIIIGLAFLLSASFLIVQPGPAVAGDVNDLWGDSDVKTNFKINSGLPAEVNNDPRVIVAQIIRDVLGFLGIIAVIIILYAGFKWMTSGGSEDQITSSKKILMAGIIGLLIILAAFSLATFVLNRLVSATF